MILLANVTQKKFNKKKKRTKEKSEKIMHWLTFKKIFQKLPQETSAYVLLKNQVT